MLRTPAPWSVQKTTRKFCDGSPVCNIVSKTNIKGETRTDDGWFVVAYDVGYTDALLLTAAPDLLEAWYETRSNNELESTPGRLQWLETFIRWIEANLGEVVGPLAGGDMNSLIHGLAELNTLCNQTRAAIAKAKGEQS